MSPSQELLAVAAALYLVECLIAVPRHALLFWSIGRGPARIVSLVHTVGTLRRAITLGMPLPPLGSTFLAEFWPVALSPAGVYGRPVEQLDVGAGWNDPEPFVRWDEIRTITSRAERLFVNGAEFATCSCAAAAEHWVRFIRELAAGPGEQRAARIEEAMRASLDVEAARAAVARLHAATGALRVACNALFALMFVLSPLVVWSYGIVRTWWVLLLGLLVMWVLTLLDFLRTHRRLFPERAGERRPLGLALGFTPVATVRAADVVGRQMLVTFHPLAIAQVVCTPEVGRVFAQRVYLDLVFPPQCEAGLESAEAVQTQSWQRERLREIIESWLRERQIDPAELLRPPVPDDPACRTYCPRCRGSHTLAEGQCATCPGVALQPFEQGGGAADGCSPAGEELTTGRN